MSEIKHTTLKGELLYLIGRASAPMNCMELYEKSELADDLQQVAKAIGNLQSDGKIVRVEGEGRARYKLADGVAAPAPAGKHGRSKAVQADTPASAPQTFDTPAGKKIVCVTDAVGSQTPGQAHADDPVAAGLDLVGTAAADFKLRQTAASVDRLAAEAAAAMEGKTFDEKSSAASLADAILAESRAQLEQTRNHLRLAAPRWWIDQDGSVEILDGDETVVLGPTQARRMAQMLLATHEALELI